MEGIPSGLQARLLAKISLWVLIYYATSVASGSWNKWLVDSKAFAVSPTFLTWFHLLVALASDAFIMARSPGEKQAREQLATEHRRTALDVVTAFTPIAVFVILSKITTYLSYQHVSIALSHTAKASEPIFNVIVAAVLFGEFHTPAVYASLIPISLGIMLASVSELSYNHYGFAVAVASALMKVLQNIYTKRLMQAGKWTFWEVHLFCGAASLVIMLPLMWVSWVSLHHLPFSGALPVAALLLDAVLQWISSVSAYVVLNLVAHLTATIINTFKRVVMITSGGLFDPNSRLTPTNIMGVALAAGGILLYNVVKDSVELQQRIDSSIVSGVKSVGLHIWLPRSLDAWAERQTAAGVGASPGGKATSDGSSSSSGGSTLRLSAVRRAVTRFVIRVLPTSAVPWMTKRLADYREWRDTPGEEGAAGALSSTSSSVSSGSEPEDIEHGVEGPASPRAGGVQAGWGSGYPQGQGVVSRPAVGAQSSPPLRPSSGRALPVGAGAVLDEPSAVLEPPASTGMRAFDLHASPAGMASAGSRAIGGGPARTDRPPAAFVQ
jgi:solute carrier family 35 protein E1